MITDQEKYLSLSTQKRDGSFVDTPVWFAREQGAGNYYVFSLKSGKKAGKVKRIRNFPNVKVAACTFSGEVTGDWIAASAELIDESEQVEFAYSLLRKKYGLSLRIGDFFSRLVGNYHRRQIIRIVITDQMLEDSP